MGIVWFRAPAAAQIADCPGAGSLYRRALDGPSGGGVDGHGDQLLPGRAAGTGGRENIRWQTSLQPLQKNRQREAIREEIRIPI